MNIKYIGYYCTRKDSEPYTSPAAVEKMTYIASSLQRAGNEIEVVSLSGLDRKKFNLRETEVINKDFRILYLSSFPRTNKFFRLLNTWWLQKELLFYLLKKVKKGEVLLVYHSVALVNICRIVKKIRKCKICLEVEEIYQDAQNLNEKLKKREYIAFRIADAYIFPSKMLGKKINSKFSKPYVVAHGSYLVQLKRQKIFQDKLIHVVYAGTFNLTKGGVKIAIESGKFLDSSYHLHIIGFGTEQEIKEVKCLVHDAERKYKCKITYDGCQRGEEYLRFIQSCDIGLSTQKSDNMLNDSSFPSKILSYLSNGLKVVTAEINVVKESAVSDKLYYYSLDDAKEVAHAIKKASLAEKESGSEILQKLDKVFTLELNKMIKEL